LGGPLAFLIVVDGLRHRLYRSVSDGDQDRLFVFAFLLALDFLFLDGEFLLEICYADFILYYFLKVICVVLVLFLILEAVFGVEEGAANVSFDGGDFGLGLLFVLVKLIHL
jgi:hypothetical protein